MRRTVLNFLLMGFSCIVFLSCSGDKTTEQTDSTRMHQFPAAPLPADTAAMVKPMPADSQHLNKMPVQPMPDSGSMPVKAPEPGIKPM